MLSNFKLNGFGLALVLGINYFSGVNSDGIPLKTCSGSNGALKYEVGKSYNYTYGSEALDQYSSFPLNEGEPKPSLQIKGNVILSPLSECEFTLTLDESVITTPDNLQGQAEPVQKGTIGKSSIRFVMQNGVVEEVFSDPNEPSWSVNVKKAIVGLIQNKAFSPEMDKTSDIETSIFGKCQLTYSNSPAEHKYSREIRLDQCGEGEGSDLIFQGVPYEVALVPNHPMLIFDGYYLNCEQTLSENGFINSASCSQLGPQIKTDLSYTSTSDAKALTDEELAKLTKSSSIIFDYSRSGLSPEIEANAVESAKTLLTSLKSDLSNKAQVFIELKKAIRRISDLKSFNDPELFKEKIHKKTFYDAVAEVTSDEGVEFLAQLIMQEELDTTTRLNLYTNMAFASKPGVKAMNALKELVINIIAEKPEGYGGNNEYNENATMAQHLLLGASGLAHQYCKMVNPDCVSVPEYAALVNAIAEHAKADGNEDIVRGALHALGNLDSLTPEAVTAIQTILTGDNSANQWLDFLVMDAFRRDPCQGSLKEAIRDILGNNQKTDQIRIHAYLAMSKCIQADDITLIESVFAEESSAAVASFIGSHIRNLKDSSSPSKNTSVLALSGITIPENVAPVHNKNRASRYFEHSTFNEKHNIGFSAEATVIFVPGNPNPMFVSLNTTLDMFGRSFNFLEIGLSQRNMMFNMMYYGDEYPPMWSSLQNGIMAKDSYYRIFGTTVGISLKNLHRVLEQSVVKVVAEDGSDGKPVYVVDMIQPGTILDEELTRPTVSGLPITYNLQASHFNSFRFEVFANGRNPLSLLYNFEDAITEASLKLKKDSASIFQGTIGLGVDTPVHVGYQVEGKVDYLQNFGIELNKKDAKTVDIKINFPEKVISSKDVHADVFSFEEINGKITKTRASSGDASTALAAREELKTCDKGGLDDVLFGIVVCHKCMQNSWERRNPMGCVFTVEKGTEAMTGWDIKVEKTAQAVEIVASTPGSESPRVYSIKLSSSKGDGTVALLDQTIEAKVQAELQNEKYEGVAKLNTFNSLSYSDPPLETVIPMDYSFSIEYLYPQNPDQMTKLFSVKTIQAKRDTLDVEAEFGQIMQPVFGDSVKIHYGNEFKMADDFSSRSNDAVVSLSISNSRLIGDSSASVEWFSNRSGSWRDEGNSYSQGVTAKATFDQTPYKFEFISKDVNFNRNKSFEYGDGKVEYYMSASDSFSVWEAKYSVNDVTHYDIKFGQGTNYESNKHNLTLDAASVVHSPHPINVVYTRELYYGNRSEDLNALTVQALGETQANINYTSKWDSGWSNLQGVINNQAEFNVSMSGSLDKETRVDMFIALLPYKITITSETDIKREGNKIIEKSKAVVVEKNVDNTAESDSLTIIDLDQRTLTITSKSMKKEQVLGRFDFFAQLAEKIYDGTSTAVMTLEDGKGQKYSGSMNDTASIQNEVFTNKFAMDFTLGSGKPFVYTNNYIYDPTLHNPDTYDVQLRVGSDDKLTWEFLGEPLDVVVLHDYNLFKLKSSDNWEVDMTVNSTLNGKDIQENKLKAQITPGSTPDAGVITVDGYSITDKFKDTMKGVISYQGNPHTLSTQHVKAVVDRTDLATTEVTHVLDMVIDKSFAFKCPMDFKMNEDGRITIMENTTVKWVQVVRMHHRELIIFKEMKKEVNGQEVSDDMFLVDIAAKVVDENHQTKLHLKSKHNLNRDCPMGNFNFTLSK